MALFSLNKFNTTNEFVSFDNSNVTEDFFKHIPWADKLTKGHQDKFKETVNLVNKQFFSAENEVRYEQEKSRVYLTQKDDEGPLIKEETGDSLRLISSPNIDFHCSLREGGYHCLLRSELTNKDAEFKKPPISILHFMHTGQERASENIQAYAGLNHYNMFCDHKLGDSLIGKVAALTFKDVKEWPNQSEKEFAESVVGTFPCTTYINPKVALAYGGLVLGAITAIAGFRFCMKLPKMKSLKDAIIPSIVGGLFAVTPTISLIILKKYDFQLFSPLRMI